MFQLPLFTSAQNSTLPPDTVTLNSIPKVESFKSGVDIST